MGGRKEVLSRIKMEIFVMSGRFFAFLIRLYSSDECNRSPNLANIF